MQSTALYKPEPNDNTNGRYNIRYQTMKYTKTRIMRIVIIGYALSWIEDYWSLKLCLRGKV